MLVCDLSLGPDSVYRCMLQVRPVGTTARSEPVYDYDKIVLKTYAAVPHSSSIWHRQARGRGYSRAILDAPFTCEGASVSVRGEVVWYSATFGASHSFSPLSNARSKTSYMLLIRRCR